METVEVQFEMWQSRWSDVDPCPQSVVEALDYCDAAFYPTIRALLTICSTLPVTTCTAERSFSALQLLKTYLRSTMTETRLSNLALLYIHSDLVVDVEDVSNRFAQKNRRLDFL